MLEYMQRMNSDLALMLCPLQSLLRVQLFIEVHVRTVMRDASVLHPCFCDTLVMTALGTECRSLMLLDMGESLRLDASVMDNAVCCKRGISF